jgi:hypothetical protein
MDHTPFRLISEPGSYSGRHYVDPRLRARHARQPHLCRRYGRGGSLLGRGTAVGPAPVRVRHHPHGHRDRARAAGAGAQKELVPSKGRSRGRPFCCLESAQTGRIGFRDRHFETNTNPCVRLSSCPAPRRAFLSGMKERLGQTNGRARPMRIRVRSPRRGRAHVAGARASAPKTRPGHQALGRPGIGGANGS